MIDKYFTTSVWAYWTGVKVGTFSDHTEHYWKKMRWEEESEVELEFAGDKTTFLDMVKWLKAARKYRCQFDGKDNIIVIWNKVENEL